MPDAPRAVPPLERLLHLKRIPLLSGLPAPEIAAIADVVQERFFAKGEEVFREDAPANAALFVVEGRLASTRRGIPVGTVVPGQGVGGMSVLARAEYGARVVAEQDTLALELDADAIADLLEDRLPILQHLIREVSRQALELLRRNKLDPSLVFPAPPGDMPGSAQLDLVDRLLLLRRMPVFDRTSVTALAELARTMAQVRFETGTVLWHEGEPAAHLVMICGGKCGRRFRAGWSSRPVRGSRWGRSRRSASGRAGTRWWRRRPSWASTGRRTCSSTCSRTTSTWRWTTSPSSRA